jgi:hypothetical protein
LNLKTNTLKETLYTLHYKKTLGGGDTGEPEETTQHSKPNLTKQELDSWLYTLEHGDFGCCFWDLRTEEH